MPDVKNDTSEKERELAERLGSILTRLNRRLRLAKSQKDLSSSEREVLMSIVRVETVRVSDLARDAAINPTMLSRIIGKLEVEGLIVRTCDADDARVIHLSVTTEGIALRNEICPEQTETLLYALGRITKNESRALNAAVPVLDKVVELLRAGY